MLHRLSWKTCRQLPAAGISPLCAARTLPLCAKAEPARAPVGRRQQLLHGGTGDGTRGTAAQECPALPSGGGTKLPAQPWE